ncbi:substrate-binding domain-containing protein [Glaciibacter superstes]|uniref:LacI family DNA-binding transcriptional regulator n=1 Tax=Glaciibacter superstes TaxID=501023 RepID=UPI00041DC557|nr:substrate-binding domain-containing protein [Glaciibacter superstes]
MQTESPDRPNLAAVARRAGVSPSTASLAFSGSGPVSDATRERVFAAARELDYAGPDPRAQSLRRGRSGIVGVVVEERVREAFRDPIKIAMLDGIAESIAPLDAGLLLLTDTGDGAVSIENAPMDAVVLIGCSPRLGHSVEVLAQRRIPMVAIEGDAGDGMPQISLDNRVATRVAAQHLKDLGHTSVAMVTLPLDPERSSGALTAAAEAASTSDTASSRLAGARDVFPSIGGRIAAASFIEEGLEAGRVLLSASARPTAILAQSDLLAAGVIRAAEEAGLRVPEDLSVIGFDGVRVDGLAYDLTTLVQPAAAKGRAAGEAIIRMLDGGTPESVAFTSEFHLGATTAPPPA